MYCLETLTIPYVVERRRVRRRIILLEISRDGGVIDVTSIGDVDGGGIGRRYSQADQAQ